MASRMATVKKPVAAKLPLPKETLLRMYRAMVLTRTLDERGMMLQRQGRIGFFVPCLGQEASQIGSIQPLEDTDWIFPSYRDVGIALYRGVPMKTIIAQLYGNAADPVKGRQMPNHFAIPSARFVSISSPIGTQISQAVGMALAAKYRKDPIISVAHFGDGGTSSNDFHAGMNFAGVTKAPIVFFCQNNQWAISAPLECQTASKGIAIKAEAYGFKGVAVDGNDALAVAAVMRQAADKARSGGGPTLIEAITYRMGPHSSSDNPKVYRDEKEVEEWKKRDPIPRFRKVLEGFGLWSGKQEKAAWEQARNTIAEAVKEVEKAPAPPVGSLFEDVYSTLPKHLQEQKAELEREIQERGGIGHGDGAFPL